MTSTVYSLAGTVSANGDIFALHDQNGDDLYDYGNGTVTEGQVNGKRNAVLAKFSATGDSLWAKNLLGTDSEIQSAKMVADGAGNIYSLIVLRKNPPYGDYCSGGAIIFKTAASGQTLWRKDAPANSRFKSLSVTSSGNIFVTGYQLANFSVNYSGTITVTGGSKMLPILSMLDTSGNYSWVRLLSGIPAIQEGLGQDIAILPSGELYLVCREISTNSGVIVHTDSTGNFLDSSVPTSMYNTDNEDEAAIALDGVRLYTATVWRSVNTRSGYQYAPSLAASTYGGTNIWMNSYYDYFPILPGAVSVANGKIYFANARVSNRNYSSGYVTSVTYAGILKVFDCSSGGLVANYDFPLADSSASTMGMWVLPNTATGDIVVGTASYTRGSTLWKFDANLKPIFKKTIARKS